MWLLIAEVVLTGAASLLFHTVQSRWSRALDMIAIGLFMLTYMHVAVRRLLGFRHERLLLQLGCS